MSADLQALLRSPGPSVQRETVIPMNLGVFLDRPAAQVPKGGMSDCLNVRVKDRATKNENMGWEVFPQGGTAINLDALQVQLIDQFFTRAGAQTLIFANKRDLFRYDAGAADLKYLTPQYSAGTVSAISAYSAGPDETTITGSGTLWDTTVLTRKNALAEDMIHFGAVDYVTQTAADWYRIKAVASDTSFTVHGDASAESTGAYSIRQRMSCDELDIFSTEVFPNALPSAEDRWFVTNGIDAPMYWNASDAVAKYFDPGFTVRILFRHKNMLLYGDITESGQRKPSATRNSNVANPQDVTTGLASEFSSTDAIDAILQYVSIGDVVVAYHERSANLMQFVGLPFIFIVRTAVPGLGPLAPGAIADFGDFHVFLAADAAYKFNGVGIQEVGPHVFRDALRRISSNRLNRLQTHVDEENGETHWILPLVSDGAADEFAGPKLAFTEHYLEETGRGAGGQGGFTPMTIRDLPATATGYFERTSQLRFSDLPVAWSSFNFRWNDRTLDSAFPFNLFGTDDGYVYILGTSSNQISGASTPVAVNSFARFNRWPAGKDRHSLGLIQRIEPFVEERPGASVLLTINLYGTRQIGGIATLKQTKTFDITMAAGRFSSFRALSRWVEVEFKTNGLGAFWDAQGYEAEYRIVGGSR